MARNGVVLASSAQRELKTLPSETIARIVRRLEILAEHPRPSGCKKLKGGENEYRIRVGDYRVVYTIEDAKLSVEVTRIRHRREAYQR